MTHPEQLGFGFDKFQEERETAHLPSAIDEGVTHYRALLAQNHQAMLAGDEKAVMNIRKKANRLAVKLNDGDVAILGGPDAPGYVLMRETAAPPGTVPMWGQQGDFTVTVGDMKVRVAMDGMLGISAGLNFWPGFSANVVKSDKPFLSETGFRSFIRNACRSGAGFDAGHVRARGDRVLHQG
jgi:hypothetical protein